MFTFFSTKTLKTQYVSKVNIFIVWVGFFLLFITICLLFFTLFQILAPKIWQHCDFAAIFQICMSENEMLTAKPKTFLVFLPCLPMFAVHIFIFTSSRPNLIGHPSYITSYSCLQYNVKGVSDLEMCMNYFSLTGGSYWLSVLMAILLPKLFWPTVRKNCSSEGQSNFWKRMLF